MMLTGRGWPSSMLHSPDHKQIVPQSLSQAAEREDVDADGKINFDHTLRIALFMDVRQLCQCQGLVSYLFSGWDDGGVLRMAGAYSIRRIRFPY
jgi:hypothetical protein